MKGGYIMSTNEELNNVHSEPAIDTVASARQYTEDGRWEDYEESSCVEAGIQEEHSEDGTMLPQQIWKQKKYKAGIVEPRRDRALGLNAPNKHIYFN